MNEIIRQAADLGEMNIPEEILNQVTPLPLQLLYWREAATNAENTTVEIWRTTDNNFVVFSGYYDGQWNPNNVQVVSSESGDNYFDQLTNAMKTVRVNYMFDGVPKAPQEPQELFANKKMKRLIRKV
jgi:hypothetical protein